VAELVVSVLLLLPRTAALGGLAAAALMLGAIGTHLLVIGVESEGDDGALFAMAWVSLAAGLGVAWFTATQPIRAPHPSFGPNRRDDWAGECHS
jgi:hypothetical protein